MAARHRFRTVPAELASPQGRTEGEGPGARALPLLVLGRSPWDLPSTRFSEFLPLNCVICIFAAYLRNIFAMWKDRASLQHGSGLTYILTCRSRFRTLLATVYNKISARPLPLRKSWVRPCQPGCIITDWRQPTAHIHRTLQMDAEQAESVSGLVLFIRVKLSLFALLLI